MTELSPTAQAVMIAATNGNTNVVNDPVYRQCIAAALRAAADAVEIDPYTFEHAEFWSALLTIAAELENQ